MKFTKKNFLCFLCIFSLMFLCMYSMVQAVSTNNQSVTLSPSPSPSPTPSDNDEPDEDKNELVDDWEYNIYPSSTSSPSITSAIPRATLSNNLIKNPVTMIQPSISMTPSFSPVIGINANAAINPSINVVPNINTSKASAGGSSIGLAAGGAKDVNNFRENIKNNYLPNYSALTYEGLFYDYYFDTGKKEETNKLFSPSYSYAISKDPLSQEKEYYLSVGLNSGMKEKDFKRKKLNLSIVLDISGSMSSSFDSYYYDKNGITRSEDDLYKSKLEIACKSIISLLKHLNPDDRLGIVLFDGEAYLGKPLNLVGKTNMDKVKKHILDLTPQGSTNFEAGYKKGTQLFDKIEYANPEEYENRIIFLTDAMPNTGQINENSLLGMTKANSQKRIFTTFIGIGVDFNTDLVEYITKIKGANYYSVNSAKEFNTRMDEEFDYMVTPLVFDLKLNLESAGYKIEKVYGSPEADEATGELMKINTLFPSKVVEEETKGGLVILKLKKISNDPKLILSTSYEDRNGKLDKSKVSFEIEDNKADYYQNTGIRKGIALTRYANLIKHWIVSETKRSTPDIDIILPLINLKTGIIIPDDIRYRSILSKWEQKSIPLKVSSEYKELYTEFIPYFKNEIREIGDDSMTKELDILKRLSEK